MVIKCFINNKVHKLEEEQRDDFFNFFLLVVTLLALDFLMAKYERPPSDIDHDHE